MARRRSSTRAQSSTRSRTSLSRAGILPRVQRRGFTSVQEERPWRWSWNLPGVCGVWYTLFGDFCQKFNTLANAGRFFYSFSCSPVLISENQRCKSLLSCWFMLTDLWMWLHRPAVSSNGSLRLLRSAVRDAESPVLPRPCPPAPARPHLVDKDLSHRPPQRGHAARRGQEEQAAVDSAGLQKAPEEPVSRGRSFHLLHIPCGLFHERQVPVGEGCGASYG